jgi:hypothetical protein
MAASGSEAGEVVVWHVARRKNARVHSGPQVRLGCGIPTVVWSHTHHLIACAGYGGAGAPLLVYTYNKDKHGARQELQLPADDAAGDAAPTAIGLQQWKSQWVESTGGGSVISAADKRALKEKVFAEAHRAAQLESALSVTPGSLALPGPQ